MSIWSWVLCYLGIGSAEQDLKEEQMEQSGTVAQGSTGTRSTASASRLGGNSGTQSSGSRLGGGSNTSGGSRFGGNNNSSSGGSRFGGNNGGSRFGRGTGAASGRPVTVHLAEGGSIDVIPLGSVVYGGRSYMVVKPPVPLEDLDGDDDRLVLIDMKNGTYDVADDGNAIMYALDNVPG